ncbi:MAG: phosphomannomutase/phosphoglucomutase [Candidatus Wallbacteria bacterium]|nr:phosphomannomutase/phosphoglucomutase [Candidatus Wallbacteria bacterium]
MGGIYKAYDVRGVYNKDWNKEDAYKIGFFLPGLLKAGKIAVGRDVRKSSDEVFENLTRGMTDAGCDVYDIGLAETPMVYFSTVKYDMDGSVSITASHNPPEYNGLKVSKKLAVPVGYDNGLDQLEKMVKTGSIKPAAKRGSVKKLDIRNDYITHLKSFAQNIKPLKVVIDTANGMGGLVIPHLLEELGFNVVKLFAELDGTFPNHLPDPLKEENLVVLKQTVIKEKADLGIAIDGDADRVMFIDENGQYISADLIIPLMGLLLLKKGKGHVLYDVRSSRSVAEEVAKLGGKPYMWKVGHAYMKLKLRELDGLYGGELAGHYYFRDNFYTDSAAVALMCVLSTLSQDNRKISQIISSIRKYHFSGEINYKVNNKDEIINKLKAKYSDGTIIDIDGVRVEFPDYWFCVRGSNTEPLLRLVVEAKTKELMDKKVKELAEIIGAGEAAAGH